MTPAKKADSIQALSWLTFAKAFWNGKMLATGVALVVSAIGIAIVRQLPAIYRAEALILVDSQKIPERFVSTTVTAEVQDRLTTISQEILSSTRLNKVIHDFNLYREERRTHVEEEILEIMRKDIEVRVEKVGGGGRPGAFRIVYYNSNPVVVAQVANEIAKLYIEENLRTREVQAEGTSEFISQQLDEAKKQLDRLETSVSEYKVRHNGQLPQQENSLLSALRQLQGELSGVQDAINRAEQAKVLLQNNLSVAESTESMLSRALRPSTGGRPESGDEPVPVVSLAPRAPTRVEQLTDQLRVLRTRYRDEHPEVRRAMRDIERARAVEAAEHRNDATGEPVPALAARASRPSEGESVVAVAQLLQARERTATLRTQIAANERELTSRHADRARILREMSSYQARVESLPLREQEMAALTRDYEMSKENYRSLLGKKVAADMAGDLERRQKAEKFTILDSARVPEMPYKPNRPPMYAGAILAGIVLGIACAIGKGLMHDHLLGEWELPKDIPLLGRVPHIKLEPTVPASLRARLGF